MIAEFVDRRGGGLLMLGGPRAFAEGGYAGTAVADTLPVVLDRQPAPKDGDVMRLQVKPTRAGSATAVTQVAGTEAASAERWNTLPGVTAVNRIDAVKPGATVLLSAPTSRARTIPMLVFQRYGRGKAFAFPPQDSWVWQMHASDPGRGPDARELLAPVAALAGGRSARSGGDRHLRPIASSRAKPVTLTASRRRSVVRRTERRVGHWPR